MEIGSYINVQRAGGRILCPSSLAFRVSVAAFVALCCAGSALAQSKWEVAPYRVAIWMSPVEGGFSSGNAEARFHGALAAAAASYYGAPINATVTSAPPSIAGAIAARLDKMTVVEVLAAGDSDVKFDKVMLVQQQRDQRGWRIAVREFDTQTYQFSAVKVRRSALPGQRTLATLKAIADAFTPLVLLEKVEGDRVRGIVRGGELATAAKSPVLVGKGAGLAAIIRHNDRLGRAASESVRVVDWTVLEVEEANAAKLTCRIHSARRNPLAARARLRLVRYALAVRPAQRNTQVVLQTSGAADAPLVDYEIAENDKASGAVHVLGRTDETGKLTVGWKNRPWRMLYVRHGDQLLARLPMIPGWQERINLPLASDDMRLAAEGLMAGIKQEVIDTVAQRQLVAARFRRQLALGEFDEAEKLLGEFRKLRDEADFQRRLNEARSQLVADNARTQQQIDNLFAETRAVLRRYLQTGEAQRMQQQFLQARRGG